MNNSKKKSNKRTVWGLWQLKNDKADKYDE